MSVSDGDPGVASPVLVVNGYVRVSGPAGVASGRASAARWRISRWTETRGWHVGDIFEEHPTPSSGRPVLETTLARVESGESDGIVVVRLSQIGDSLEDVLATIERVQAAGGALASLGEGIDLTTVTGSLMLRLLLAVRAW